MSNLLPSCAIVPTYFIIETEEIYVLRKILPSVFILMSQLNQSNTIAHQWWHKFTPVKKVTTRKTAILRHATTHNCLLSCVMIWSRITLNLSHTHTHDYAECKNLMCRFLRVVPFHFYLLDVFFLPLYCYYYFFLLSVVWFAPYHAQWKFDLCVCARRTRERVCAWVLATQCHKIRQYVLCAANFKVETMIFRRNVATTVFRFCISTHTHIRI